MKTIVLRALFKAVCNVLGVIIIMVGLQYMLWKLHPNDLILNGIFPSNGTQNGQVVIERLPGIDKH
jgi:hypothetical protein